MSPALADVQLAYLAGFFDGEGNIRIAKNSKARNGKGYYLRISATQIDQAPLVMLQQQFGGYVYKRKSEKASRDGYVRRVPTSDWIVAGPRAAAALRALLPYLVVKREAARLGLRFQKAVRPNVGGSRSPLSPAEVSERQFYADALTVRTNHQRTGGVGGDSAGAR